MKDFIKSIFAGIMIGIAGQIYLNNQNYFGMIIFATALIVICYLEYNLYTGKIGYINNFKDLLRCFTYLAGNSVGCLFIALSKQNSNIILNRMTSPWYIVFMKAFICGFLIYCCVQIFKKHKTPLGIIYCIPTFLAFKAEHCVANIYFIIATRTFNFEILIFIIIVILGNSCGSIVAHIADK